MPIRRIGDNRPVQISSSGGGGHYNPYVPPSYSIQASDDGIGESRPWPRFEHRAGPRRGVPFAARPIMSSGSDERSREYLPSTVGFRTTHDYRNPQDEIIHERVGDFWASYWYLLPMS